MTDLNELLKDVVVPLRGTPEFTRYATAVMYQTKYSHLAVLNVAMRDSRRGRWSPCDYPTWEWHEVDYAIIPEPAPPVVTPYRKEQRHELRGRWYRDKTNNIESQVIWFEVEDDFFTINGFTPDGFLRQCEWIDPATGEATGPCGNVQ